MHFSCEDIFKNQRFQYFRWEEGNNLALFRLNPSHWAPFTPKFSVLSNTVNFMFLGESHGKGRFHTSSCWGIYLLFSCKDGEGISASLSMYENPSPPVPLQTSDDLCLWTKLVSASRKVPEKQVHQPVTWREAVHTRWSLSGHHAVESSVGWELSLWCCTIKWKGGSLSLEGNQLQREV